MAKETFTLPLIRTKLYRPRIPGELIPRPGLLEQLNRGLDRNLTLVSAPAGFGKTTLLATWLETCARPAAWLQLDEEDSDLVVFLSYLLAAIQTLSADAVNETLGSAGRALLTTTLILVASFWMRLFSDLKVIADFGLIMGIALLVAFLADVLLAPALLRIYYGIVRTEPPKRFDVPGTKSA